jgi:hypothetical protein
MTHGRVIYPRPDGNALADIWRAAKKVGWFI